MALGASVGGFGPLGGPLVISWRRVGGLLGGLGAILGGLGAVLGGPGAVLG